MNDAHFYQLVTNPRSYDEHIPNWLVPVLATVGMLTFYAASFTLRPLRIVELVRAIAVERPRTRLESALIRLRRNRKRQVLPVQVSSGAAAHELVE